MNNTQFELKRFCAETEIISTRLLDNVHRIYPNLRFCGKPRDAILGVSDDLLIYVLSLLKDDFIRALRVSIKEWSEFLHIGLLGIGATLLAGWSITGWIQAAEPYS